MRIISDHNKYFCSHQTASPFAAEFFLFAADCESVRSRIFSDRIRIYSRAGKSFLQAVAHCGGGDAGKHRRGPEFEIRARVINMYLKRDGAGELISPVSLRMIRN